MEKIHEKFGKCVIAEITQKQLEDFSREVKGKDNEPMPIWRGDSVRAATKIGMLLEPKMTGQEIDNAKPALILWLANCIGDAIQEAMKIDPLS